MRPLAMNHYIENDYSSDVAMLDIDENDKNYDEQDQFVCVTWFVLTLYSWNACIKISFNIFLYSILLGKITHYTI